MELNRSLDTENYRREVGFVGAYLYQAGWMNEVHTIENIKSSPTQVVPQGTHFMSWLHTRPCAALLKPSEIFQLYQAMIWILMFEIPPY
jgi:hypothetical protein